MMGSPGSSLAIWSCDEEKDASCETLCVPVDGGVTNANTGTAKSAKRVKNGRNIMVTKLLMDC